MNPKIIQNTLQQSLAGTTTFPQVVQTLLQEGFWRIGIRELVSDT